jgi:hypothetical protein
MYPVDHIHGHLLPKEVSGFHILGRLKNNEATEISVAVNHWNTVVEYIMIKPPKIPQV